MQQWAQRQRRKRHRAVQTNEVLHSSNVHLSLGNEHKTDPLRQKPACCKQSPRRRVRLLKYKWALPATRENGIKTSLLLRPDRFSEQARSAAFVMTAGTCDTR